MEHKQQWVVVVETSKAIEDANDKLGYVELVCYGPFDTREIAENWGNHNEDQFKGDWRILPITPAF